VSLEGDRYSRLLFKNRPRPYLLAAGEAAGPAKAPVPAPRRTWRTRPPTHRSLAALRRIAYGKCSF
jgi:hypothetical protein